MIMKAFIIVVLMILFEIVIAKKYTRRFRNNLKKIYFDWAGIDAVVIF